MQEFVSSIEDPAACEISGLNITFHVFISRLQMYVSFIISHVSDIILTFVTDCSGKRIPPAVLVGGAIFSMSTLSSRGTSLLTAAVAIVLVVLAFVWRCCFG